MSISSTRPNIKVDVIKNNSLSGLCGLIKNNLNKFDIIYVDGSHYAKNVLEDCILSWNLLTIGGILICDDYLFYGFKGGIDPQILPKCAIDAFITTIKNQYIILEQNYQIFIQKTKNISNTDFLTMIGRN